MSNIKSNQPMKKIEVYNLCRVKSSEGYETHPDILTFYEGNADIPDYVVEIICHPHDDNHPYREYFGKELEQLAHMKLTHNDLRVEIQSNTALAG